MTPKLQAITKGSQVIDKIFWELLKILSARGGSESMMLGLSPSKLLSSGGKPERNLTEKSLASFIKRRAKELGAQGMAFPPIVSFGESSAEIHHKPNHTRIGKNNFLMLDYGVKVQGFCSDFTRTLFLGTPTKQQAQIYNIVLTAQAAAIKKLAVGKTGDEIDFAARHVINKAGFGKLYNHGTGHGVTQKIHDLPNFKPSSGDVIRQGHIVTIEPGIYLPKKYGIRIEDMVIVSHKSKILSKVPKDFKSMIIKI